MSNEIQVKERPLLFKAAMVNAIFGGTKTQTRRPFSSTLIINQEPGRYKFHYYGECDGSIGQGACFEDLRPEITPWITPIACPYGEPGERLWVKETFYAYGFWKDLAELNKQGKPKREFVDCTSSHHPYRYADDAPGKEFKPSSLYGLGYHKRPSLFMPRLTSRILLEIVSVRVERLQDISEADAVAEGIKVFTAAYKGKPTYKDYSDEEFWTDSAVDSYGTLWESINGPGSWAANPWVWVVSFRVVK